MLKLLPYILLALLAGLCAPTQAGINAELARSTRSYSLAATVSFAVGTVSLIVYCLLTRVPMPPPGVFAGRPWWIWTGGLLGALFVVATTLLAPRLGATALVGLVLAGQLMASLLLDQFGVLGYPVRPINLSRLAGLGLLIVGALLVLRR